MKVILLCTFVFLAVVSLATSSPQSRPVHGATPHSRDRSNERDVDINEARRAMGRGDAWLVRTERRNGTERNVYEGSYQSSEGMVHFRMVVAAADSHVVTIIRLVQAPTRQG
ncbi:hypothetical protein ACKWTF_005750 [Chironomus riparius]